ncbi:MAG: hypothetical protein WCZ90_05675 [Melioribacteraceae bacterium]
MNYTNRPLVEIKPKSITIVEDYAGSWKLVLQAQLLNKGNTGGIVSIQNLNLEFPEYSKKNLAIKVDELVELSANSSKEKSFMLEFPDIFEKIDFEKIPVISGLVLEAYEQVNNAELEVRKDSLSFIYSFVFGATHKGKYKSENIHIDTLRKKVSLKTKSFFIEYKGKRYLNKIFPPNANVRYSIENDNIYIEYALTGIESSFDNNSNYLEPLVFLADKEIQSKIIMPKKTRLVLKIENEEEDRKTYEKYELELQSKTRNYLYIIK